MGRKLLILTLILAGAAIATLGFMVPRAGSTEVQNEIIRLERGDVVAPANTGDAALAVPARGPEKAPANDNFVETTEVPSPGPLDEAPVLLGAGKSAEKSTPSKPDQSVILQGGDNIATATAIGSLPYHDAGSTVGYTDDYDGSCGSYWYDPDVVYSFTPTANVKVDISTWESFFDTRLYVFQTDQTNEIACRYVTRYPQARIFNLDLVAGVTYYIVVDGEDGSEGYYVLDVFQSPAPPPNDNCASALPELLEAYTPRTFSGTTLGATDDCGLVYGEEVWHAIYVPECMYITIDWCGNDPIFSPISSQLVTGCPCESAIEADNFDWDACGDGNGTITFYNVAPGTYYIPIKWHYRNAGPYTIHVTGIPCSAFEFSCPASAVPEAETTCYDGYVDNFNNGCGGSPYNFSPVTFGDTICGTSGNFFTIYNRMDGDNYLINLTEPKILTLSASAEFNMQVVLGVLAGSALCDDYYYLFEEYYASFDTATIVTLTLEPGQYYARIRPQSNEGTVCGSRYWFTAQAQDPPPPPYVECPPGAWQEGEPACGPGYDDTYNSGCNSPTPVFLQISSGDTVCGTSGTFLNQGYNYRDTDWYRYEQTFSGPLTFTAMAQFPILLAIFDSRGGDCSQAVNIGQTYSGPGELASLQVDAGRGVYWLVATTLDYTGYPCPLNYWATVQGPQSILHDVSLRSLDSPTQGRLFDGVASYPITISLSNASSVQETFDLAATDNQGFASYMNGFVMPAMSETTFTFTDLYRPMATCLDLTLAVTATLTGDPNTENNTKSIPLAVASSTNFTCAHDSLDLSSVYYFPGDLSIIAAQQFVAEYDMDLVYIGARTYAQEFGGDNGWPDATRDPFKLYLFLDWDFDNMPDLLPEYEGEVISTGQPSWSYLVLPCTISVAAGQSFWVGWSNIDDQYGEEALAADPELNFPANRWVRYGGNMWVQDSEGQTGDDMLRAWSRADLANAPQISFNLTRISGSVQNTGEADTVSLLVTNNGVNSLSFGVNTVHSYTSGGLLSAASPEPIGYHPASQKSGEEEPFYPPITLSAGGPDMFGYNWIDSDEPGGPAPDWIDISVIGTRISMGDESMRGPYPLGFNFPYYENSYPQIWLSSNGWISFGNPGYSYYNNQPIPYLPIPDNIIAMWWDDLSPGDCGDVYIFDDTSNGRFIVSYTGVCFFGNDYETVGNLNFQAVLYPNGNICLNYDIMNFDYYQGNRATVGIENADGSDGLGITFNAEYVHNYLTIQITRPTAWLSLDTNGGTLPGGQSQTINVVLNAAAPYADTTLSGALRFLTNDPDEPIFFLPATLAIGQAGGCQYLPGDINGNGTTNGIDVGYGVNYFKGGPPPPVRCDMCPQPAPFFAGGDVNGNCVFNGIDITFFVNYLKGIQPALLYCADCPPSAVVSTVSSAKKPLLQLRNLNSTGN